LDFLDTLPLTAPEKEKLRALAVSTPDELYNLIKASADDHSFEKFFGKERTFHLIRFLFPLVKKYE